MVSRLQPMPVGDTLAPRVTKHGRARQEYRCTARVEVHCDLPSSREDEAARGRGTLGGSDSKTRAHKEPPVRAPLASMAFEPFVCCS